MGRPATGQTPIRQVRIPDDEWDAFRAVTGTDNVKVLRQLMRWYLRRERTPARPTPEQIKAALAAAAEQ